MQETLNTLIDLLPEGILVYDHSKKIVQIKNKSFFETFTDNAEITIPQEEKDSKGEQSSWKEEIIPFEQMLATLEEGNDKKIQVIQDEDTRKTYTVKSRLIKSMGERTTLNTFIDHTEIIEHAQVQAQKKYQKLMLASVTHELKTPLNTIKASIDQMIKT